VPILIGLGVDELSVSVPAIPAIKAQVRGLRKTACVELAEKAMKLAEAKEVRDLISKLVN
jgi:phosphocarrier protein FPr